MGSKAFVFLGLFLAVALLISSEVLAKDLAETATSTTPTTADQQTNGIDDAKFRGRRGDTRPGRGFRGGRYGGGGGGSYRGGGGGYGRSGYNEEGN